MNTTRVLTLDGVKQSGQAIVSQTKSLDFKPDKAKVEAKDKVDSIKLTPSRNAEAKRIGIYKIFLPYFQKRYPKCFTMPASPLSVGIDKQLIENKSSNHSEMDIKIFLSMYVNTAKYNESMVEGASRVDIHGKTTSTISANDAGFAKAKLKSILAARKRRNEANKSQHPKTLSANPINVENSG